MTKVPERVERAAWWALGLLFAVNLLNYIDRQIISGVQDLIQAEFKLTGLEIGLVGSSFVVVYMLAAPITGVLADRWPRHWFIAGGVSLWSIATAAAGSAGSYLQLLSTRATVGIGEAGYATVSPGLISDLFPLSLRGRAMSLFFMAIPVGSALGIGLGGYLGAHYGWRTAFQVVGLPGLLVAIAALWLPDPARGAMDDVGGKQHAHPQASFKGYLSLLRIPSYVINTVGMTAYTFSIQGLAFWMPRYLLETKLMPRESATLYFGLVSAAAGFVGTIAGGWAGDALQKKTPRAYFLLSGIGLILGVPFGCAAILCSGTTATWSMLFLSEVLLFLNTGPLNAALANVVPASMRASAFALNIFVIHLLGDVASPPLIGMVRDHAGPTTAMLAAIMPMGLAGAVYLWGMGYYGQDVHKASD
ncbi:MAG: MFS transporter [Candidatus Wallbacteria bacterium]|nr:MFS transporter [Candidatus Wallbacteria bacterium]